MMPVGQIEGSRNRIPLAALHAIMNPRFLVLVLLALAALLISLPAFADEPPIDVPRAKELMQKSQRGETLSPEDQKYLDHVKQVIRERNAGRAPGGSGAPAPGSTPKPIEVSTADWSALVPITELTAPYKGEDG